MLNDHRRIEEKRAAMTPEERRRLDAFDFPF